MTEAEALDMAAQVAGWLDWKNACHLAECGEIDVIRAHAKTIMGLAELMTTCEEATTRMELMYLQHRKVVDENAALEAKLADVSKALMATAEVAASSAKKGMEAEARLAVAREALEEIADVGDDVDCSDCKASGVSARAALKEIDNGDR